MLNDETSAKHTRMARHLDRAHVAVDSTHPLMRKWQYLLGFGSSW